MERLFSKAKTANTGVFSDPSNRMSRRPGTVKSGQGVGFEDFGSTLGRLKTGDASGKASEGKFKPAGKPAPKSRKAPPRIPEDESDDELLLSSQTSVGDDATSSSKRVVERRERSTTSETVRVNGRVLAAHPDYKPSSSDAVKGIRFKKNRNTSSNDAVAEVPPPSSSLDESQDLLEPISDDIEVLGGSPQGGLSSSRQRPSETRRKSPTQSRTSSRCILDANDSSTSKPTTSTADGATRSPARPRPRNVKKPPPLQRDSSPESTPRPAAQKRGFPLRSKSPELPSNAESRRTDKRPVLPSSSRREPQEFPMSLQAKENVSDCTWSSDGPSKAKKAGVSRSATSVHTPKPIPLPSPLKMKPFSRSTTFPNLSPLASFNDKTPNDKGKARAKSPDVGDGEPGRGNGLKPFPMSSQMPVGIDRRSKSPSTRSPKSTKRTSSDGSGAEQGPTAKKRKDSRSEAVDSFDYLHEAMEDDSFDLGYARDPSKLCPYCDEELPSHPTPFLQHLLAIARQKSFSDARPRNRGGLKAPLTVYISVCQRHRFESHQLPIATERGWPKSIDFTKVPARVKKMKKELEAIILDKDDINSIESLGVGDWHRGPRSKSVFWREVKKEVKRQGSRTVMGVKGQFASFEKTQPGYYGEQGSVIIHQTLFDLFPPSTFDASLITPLAPAEFIQRILVPEVAVRLIIQDLCVDMEDAIVTLRDSAQYGVAMFPDTGENKRRSTHGDDDEMGVADRIVMERARARRKEIAEEEKVEKEMLEEERAAQRAKARAGRWEKAVEKAQQARQNKARVEGKVEGEDISDASVATKSRRTRRETGELAVTDGSESDAMSVDSLARNRSACITKKRQRGDRAKMIKAIPLPNSSDSDSVRPVDGWKQKTSIKNGTRECSVEPDTRGNTRTTAARERKKPTPFGGFAALDDDGERESTPRPARQRTTATGAAGSATNGLHARVLPLQVARNRSGTSAPTTHGGWSLSLRTSIPDDTDSDASNTSRISQRLARPPIRRRAELPWLFSSPSQDST